MARVSPPVKKFLPEIVRRKLPVENPKAPKERKVAGRKSPPRKLGKGATSSPLLPKGRPSTAVNAQRIQRAILGQEPPRRILDITRSGRVDMADIIAIERIQQKYRKKLTKPR